MEAGKAVYNILTNDSALALIVDEKIYPEVAKQSDAAPYVTYTVDISETSGTKSASSSVDEQTVTVHGISENYSECMDIGIAVRAVLDRNGGAFAGVQVQSVDFERADVHFDFDHGVYIIEHVYTMRVLRVGNATEANLASVTSIYQIQSADIKGTHLVGGASAIDFNSATPQVVPFNQSYQSTGTDIALGTTTHIITVAASGWYRISWGVEFSTGTDDVMPSTYAKVETREMPTEAGAYMTAGGTTAGCAMSRTEYLTANDRVQIWAYDRSSVSGTIYLVAGFFIVERIA